MVSGNLVKNKEKEQRFALLCVLNDVNSRFTGVFPERDRECEMRWCVLEVRCGFHRTGMLIYRLWSSQEKEDLQKIHTVKSF